MGGVRTACGSPHAVWRQIFGQLLQAAGRDIWAPPSWRAPLLLGNTLATLLFASSSYAILMFHSVFRAFDGLQ